MTNQCTLTESEKHPLQEALEELRGDYDIRGYSGRGMYGKQCLSINVSQCDMNILQLGFDLATTDAFSGGGGDELPRMCWDNMGLGRVYYWPSVPYVEGEGE